MSESVGKTILPWHKPVWRLFSEYRRSERLPQALLLIGAPGMGKFRLSRQWAQALLCERAEADQLACYDCSACNLLQAGNHPDFLTVEPEEPGKALGIKKIRELLEHLTLKPHFERNRIVIIHPADQMTHAAANAFLKCLEEPPLRTLILLIAENTVDMPATIVSRCQQVLINAPNPEQGAAWLQKQGVTEQIGLLLNLADRAPLLAYRYDQEGVLQRRQAGFKQWCAVADGQTAPIAVAEQWLTLPIDELMSWLLSWVMDLIKLKLTGDNAILINTDFIKALQELAQRLKLTDLFQYYDLLIISRQRLQSQLNQHLIFEQILLEWSGHNQG